MNQEGAQLTISRGKCKLPQVYNLYLHRDSLTQMRQASGSLRTK